jgi:hypothetical protein
MAVNWRAHDAREEARRFAFGAMVLLAATALASVPVARWLLDEERGCGGGLFASGEYFFSCGGNALFGGFYCETGPVECVSMGGGQP